MNTKLAELRKADPTLKHTEAYQRAFDEWKVRRSGTLLRALEPATDCFDPLMHLQAQQKGKAAK